MKRRMLAATLLGCLVLAITPARAGTSGYHTNQLVMSYQAGDDWAYVMAFAYTDHSGQTAPGSNITVSVGNASGMRYGGGNGISLTFDPVMMTGSLSGTVLGQDNQPIILDLDYLTTSFGTSTLPQLATVEVAPPPGPSAGARFYTQRTGRVNGTITSSLGTLTVVNGPATVTDFNDLNYKP